MTTLLNPPEVELQKAMAIAAEKGDGQFVIRVTKKNQNSMVPLSMITFNDGAIAHLANLESWVPRLVGGGEFTVVANHMTNVGLRFVFACNFLGGSFPAVNTNAIQQTDWSGPASVTQVAEQAQAAPQQPAFSAAPAFSQFQPRPQQQPVFPMSAAGAVAGAQAFQQMPADAGAQLLAVQRHASEESAKLAAREAAQAQRETEDRLRREMLDRESKHKAELESLKQMITAGQKPVEKTDYVAIFAGIAAALAPIAKSIMDSGSESRRLAAEQSNKLAEMQMTTNRELAAIQQKANEAQTAMLMKLTEQKGTSPEMEAMLRLHTASTESQGAMMNQIVNATGMVSKMSIGMIETIADMNAPPEGSPMIDAIKEGVKALGALAGGTDSGARKAIAAQQNLLPKREPATQPQQPGQPTPAQLQAARQRAAQANAQAAAQQAAYQQMQQAAQQVPLSPQSQQQGPATVIPFPDVRESTAQAAHPPSHNPPPTLVNPIPPPSAVVIDAPVQAFGDVEMPDGFSHVEVKTVLDSLEELIRVEHNPEVVATTLFDSLQDPEFKAALEVVEGDPEKLLGERLGLPWCMEHQEYLENLGNAIEDVARARGLLADDDEDEGTGQQAAGDNQ